MSPFWQVFLGVIAAWLAIQLVLTHIVKRMTRVAERSERFKVTGQEAIARAVVDELEKREATRK